MGNTILAGRHDDFPLTASLMSGRNKRSEHKKTLYEFKEEKYTSVSIVKLISQQSQ